MNTSTRIACLFIFLLYASCAFATHDRAGEITYRFIGPNTISATITTYTKASSIQADRDSLPLTWGDGTVDIIARTNGPDSTGLVLGSDIKYNLYQSSHTYASLPASGFVVIFMTDVNRNADIINIDNSVNVPFYVEDTIWFAGQGGNNNGPVLLYPPVDFAYVGDTFFHNPAAYDVEADSLTFEFIVPLQAEGMVAPGYLAPDHYLAPGSPNNVINLNRLTGELIWATPQLSGIYNIAILIREYRYGNVLSTMVRDMQIIVLDDSTAPPHLSGAFTDTVITSGMALALPYSAAGDPSLTDTMAAYSGIFLLPGSNAVYVSSPATGSTSGMLTWTPGHNQYKERETRIVAVQSVQQSAYPHAVVNAFRVTVVDSAFATGIADIATDGDVTVYPVPACDRLYINAVLPAAAAIVDMQGRQLPLDISGQQIDISSLAEGMYLLRWQSEGKTYVKRFIKE